MVEYFLRNQAHKVYLESQKILGQLQITLPFPLLEGQLVLVITSVSLLPMGAPSLRELCRSERPRLVQAHLLVCTTQIQRLSKGSLTAAVAF